MVIILDANVWVSAVIPTETHHLRSYGWLTSWIDAGHRLVVPDLFLVEVAGTMARRRNDPAAGIQALEDLRSEPALDVAPLRTAGWATSAEIAAAHLLRGADAVYVALALQEGLPLVTWDQTVLLNAAAVVDVRTPDQMPI